MKCSSCDRRAVYFAQHFGKFFCEKHLKEHLIKKLRRTITRYKLIRAGDSLSFPKEDSPVETAEIWLLKRATKGWPVEFGGGKQVLGDSLDLVAEKIIENFSQGKTYTFSVATENSIAPFLEFETKALFTLGWLLDNHKEGVSGHLNLGVSAKLNLVKVWKKMMEALE